MKAEWQAEKDAIHKVQRRQGAPRAGPARARARRARGRPRARRRAAPRRDPRAAARAARGRGGRAAGEARFLKEEVDAEDVAEVVGKLDRHPGHPPARGRGREARPHGGAPAPARHRPGRGRRGGLQRAAPLARRPQRPRSPDRHLPLPRPDRRRQDRAGPRAGRVHVRLPGRDGAHRHVGVHGEALRLPPRRRAARLRRLRRGRPAHRGRAPAPVLRASCSTRSRRPTPTSSTCCCR